MKNHDQLLLPFDDTLHRLLSVLVRQNDAIRREYGVQNKYVFVTKQGGVISNSPTHNNIPKRLNKYSKNFGLRNINPNALRRGFAKSLLNKGANIMVYIFTKIQVIILSHMVEKVLKSLCLSKKHL